MKYLFSMLAAVAVMGAVVEVQAEVVNGIMAVAHDSIVTQQEVQDMTMASAAQLQRQYQGQNEALQKKLAQVEHDNLEQLLDRQLILHEFSTAGYSLPESVIEDVVQERIRAKYRDRMTLIHELQAEGITYEKFRQRVREQFIEGAMRQKNVASEIIISPHKVEVYYQAHLDEFKVGDEVKLRMLVFTKSADPNLPEPEAIARDVLAKLKEGASFTNMASEVGQRAQELGEGGWIEKSVLRKELTEPVSKLKPGGLSEPVVTPDGIYLLLLEDARPARARPLAEVRDQIERNLNLGERNRLEKQWIDRLRKKTFVRYF
jgi:peptidyl-prolyl cis-trans isomerase SurA